jgi:N-acetylneuraminic acid mutarotase
LGDIPHPNPFPKTGEGLKNGTAQLLKNIKRLLPGSTSYPVFRCQSDNVTQSNQFSEYLCTFILPEFMRKSIQQSLAFFALGVSLSASFLVGCSNSSDVTVMGNWRNRSELEGVARQGASGFVIGTKAYIGTGLNFDRDRLTDFWEYDQARNTWTQRANYAGVGRYQGVGFAIGNKGYIGTGLDVNSARLKDFYSYDPATNAWTKIADYAGTGRYGAVAFTLNNKGYVGTGNDGGNFVKDFYAYDPAANTWSRIASYSGSKRVGALAMVINNVAYVGFGNNNQVEQKDLWAYNPANDSWDEKNKFPDDLAIARSYGVGFVIGTKGYVGLGTGNGNFYSYDPATDTWADMNTFEYTARVYAVGLAIGNKGYVVSGSVGTGVLDDLREYDPSVARIDND